MPPKLIYAIDFGTSNSLLAAATTDEVFAPIPLEPEGSEPSILRSLVYYLDNETAFYGKQAIDQYVANDMEGRLFRSLKRFLPNPHFTATRIGDKSYQLEEIIGGFLRELKARADRHFGQNVREVVFGRPAKFSADFDLDHLAQNRLRLAALEAGFHDIHFCPEPLAAAYDYRRQITEEKVLLVADMGGGTSDFTVLRLKPKTSRAMEVLSIGGLSVAGDAIDGSLMKAEIAPYFGSELSYQLPMSNNRLSMPADIRSKLQSPSEIALFTDIEMQEFLKLVQRSQVTGEDREKLERLFVLIEDNLGFQLFEEVEKTKKALCMQGTTVFEFDYPGIEVRHSLSYEDLMNSAEKKIDAIFETMDEVIQEAGMTYKDIDVVCLTGGTSKLPEVQRRLIEKLGETKIQTHQQFHSVIQGLVERAQEVLREQG